MALPIPFNNPRTYPGHSGVDYPQPHGTPFKASGNGVVTTLGRNARGGFYIWVQYDNGPHVGYHHMPSHKGCPKRGTRVSEGTRLGYVGSTGNSTGPHLHSEVAGYATTAGYWRFFDRSRVVGSGAPSFPLRSGYYFGPRFPLTNLRSVSGYFTHRNDLRRWQQRMKDRGWTIAADGRYGNQTRSVAIAFQKEKGLKVDGLIGPATWSAAWTAPIT